MKTGQFNDAAFAVTSYQSVSGTYNTTTTAVTVGGYFSVTACANTDGYGYYAGSSQLCPAGYYNAKGNKLPCTKCPIGMTTDWTKNTNMDASYCIKYIAGYGLVNGATSKCLPGSYMVEQTTTDDNGVECTACPTGTTTRTSGSGSLNDCNVCAPGYGANGTGSCVPCGDGYYGPAGGDTTSCTVCPTGRTYTYSWDGTDDVFTPLATSPYGASTTDDCVADFAQTVDGAFYLNLTKGAGFAATAGGDNVATCVQLCRDDAACAAVTFDYNALVNGGQPCWKWKPSTVKCFTESGGVAVKVFPSTSLAQVAGRKKPGIKATGNGQYTFWMDGSATGVPARIDTASLSAEQAGVITINDCLDTCTSNNLCVGVVFGACNGSTGAIAATSPATAKCKLITATVQPGNAKRTLLKANFNSYINTLIVPAGFYTDPASNVIKICSDTVAVDNDVGDPEVAFYCPGGVIGDVGLRVSCGPVTGATNGAGGANGKLALGTPADAKTAADCWSTLQPGYYSTSGLRSGAAPCVANSYCLGGAKVAVSGGSANLGLTPCPTGTNNVAGKNAITSLACATLLAGYYYDSKIDTGAITGNNVLACPVGYKCAGGLIDLAGDLASLLPVPLMCPPGTTANSGLAANELNCTTLLPGYYYTATGNISNNTIKVCPVNAFCPGALLTNDNSGTFQGITDCPGWTCVIHGPDTCHPEYNTGVLLNPYLGGSGSTTTGNTNINQCIDLNPGYYYQPDSTFSISGNKNLGGTIKPCPLNKWCSGDENVNLLNTTGITGTCITGATSESGATNIDECNELRPGYYYIGTGHVSESSVVPCPSSSYCPGNGKEGVERIIVNSGPYGLFDCPPSTTCSLGTGCNASRFCLGP